VASVTLPCEHIQHFEHKHSCRYYICYDCFPPVAYSIAAKPVEAIEYVATVTKFLDPNDEVILRDYGPD
jgi:hypothetical protein